MIAGDSAAAQARAQLKQWLPAREAAAYCALGFSTLAKLRLTGGGPAFSKVGTKVLYNRNDLDSWLDSKRVASTSQVEG
jgi:hypothetical protein